MQSSDLETWKSVAITAEKAATATVEAKEMFEQAIEVMVKIDEAGKYKGKGKGHDQKYQEAIDAFRKIEEEAEAHWRLHDRTINDHSKVKVLIGCSVRYGVVLRAGHGHYQDQYRIQLSDGQDQWVAKWRCG